MAQTHIPKDPSNQPSIPFTYDPINVKTRAGYSHKKFVWRDVFG